MKQIIKNILTFLFGYKYFIVVYQINTASGFVLGNKIIKLKRLHKLEVDWVRGSIADSNGYNKGNVVVLNLIRVEELDDNFN